MLVILFRINYQIFVTIYCKQSSLPHEKRTYFVFWYFILKKEKDQWQIIFCFHGVNFLSVCVFRYVKITLSMHIRILSSVLIKSHSNIFASSWKNVAQYILVNEKICFKVLPSFSVSINFEKPHSWLPYSLQKSKSTCFTRALWSKWAYEFQS